MGRACIDDIYTDEWSALLFESLFSDLAETPHKTRRNIGREVENDRGESFFY
jgi:hypothetical protein